jgi:putative transposase
MASGRRYEMSFFTATILEWKPLLANDRYKNIIINSMRYMVSNNKVQLYAFAIMDNHVHILWHILHPHKREDVQRDLLKFTAQTMLHDLRDNHPALLANYYVGLKDREYQVWERNPLSIPVWSEEVVKEKLDYIHNNPVKAGYCTYPEDYKYSSAAVYQDLPSEWDFVMPCYL